MDMSGSENVNDDFSQFKEHQSALKLLESDLVKVLALVSEAIAILDVHQQFGAAALLSHAQDKLDRDLATIRSGCG